MLVSVIIPVYNVEKYIEKCMRSILGQTFDDFEIIVVIDGSTDESENIVRELKKEYPEKIKIITQEKKGPGAARNAGIAAADGDYLLFVDSDDYISPNLMASAYGKAVETQSDIVAFDVIYVDENGKHLRRKSAVYSDNESILKEPGRLLILPCLWNKLYKKSLFDKNNVSIPENILMGEDLAVNAELLSSAQKITHLAEPLYFYVQRSGSIMSLSTDVGRLKRNRDIIPAFETIFAFFNKTGRYVEYKDEIEYLAVYHILFTATMRVNECDPNNKLQSELVDYTLQKYPYFEKNKYYKSLLSGKDRISIWFLRHKLFHTLHTILRFNRKLQGR